MIGNIFENLDSDTGLAGDDVEVVEGMDENDSGFLRAGTSHFDAVVDRFTLPMDRRPKGPDSRQLAAEESTGMNTSQGTPNLRAAYASDWA